MDRVLVGEIVAPQGIHGEVRVIHYTDSLDRLLELEAVYIGDDDTLYTIKKSRLQKNVAILKIDSIDTIDQAEALRGAKLSIPLEHRKSLDDGQYFMDDLLGLIVKDLEGNILGEVINFIDSTANDILVIDYHGEEILIPFVYEFIVKVDLKSKYILVDPIEGMIP